MFDKSVYAKILNNNFSEPVRVQGKELYKNQAVLKLELESQKHTINSSVTDDEVLYDQIIKFTNSGDSLVLSKCTCAFTFFCKHQAAILYKLIEGDLEAMIVANAPTKKMFADTPLGFEQEVYPDKYNQINYFEGNLEKSIQKYCTKINTNFSYHHQASIGLYEHKHLKVTIQRKHEYTSVYHDEAIVDIKTIDNTTAEIKCSKCGEPSNFLCDHQSFSLHALHHNDLSRILNLNKTAFEEINEKAAGSLGLSVEKFREYFHLIYDHNAKLVTTPKTKGLSLNPKTLGKSLKMSRRDKIKIASNVQKRNKEQALDESLLWSTIRSSDYCSILQGKKRKKSDIISSAIKQLEYPKKLKEDLTKVFNKLRNFEDNQALNKIHNQYKALVFLKENINVLQSENHYFQNQVIDYYSSRKNDKKYVPFNFSNELISVYIRAEKDDILYKTEIKLFTPLRKIDLDRIDFIGQFFIVAQGIAYLYEQLKIGELIYSLDGEGIYKYLPTDENLFKSNLLNLKSNFELKLAESLDINFEKIEDPKKAIYLSQEEEVIYFEPKIQNEQTGFFILQNSAIAHEDKFIEAEKGEIETFKNALIELHPSFESQLEYSELLFLTVDQFMDDLWFYDFYKRCKEAGIEVFGQEKLGSLNFNQNKAKINSTVKSGIDWFDVKVNIQFGDQFVSTKKWIDAIKNNKKYVKLDDGSIGIIPEDWFQKLSKIISTSEIEKDEIRLSKYSFNMIDELFLEIDDAELLEEIARKREKLISVKTKEFSAEDLPKAITADLRPYQLQGYSWLRFLHESEFGGILADDMGLGKTLQAICVIAHAIETTELPILVVVPRSLLFNWANEIEKFYPTLQYLIYHGPNRDKSPESINSRSLLISTYDTIASDIELFKDLIFEYVILDESQAIKNPTSKRYKAMRLLQGNHKLTMTGTPIENNTFDLFAQMSFVNPGWLGSAEKFKREFSNPIDVNQDSDAAKLLQKMIYPFVLRRTKEQVATDLPEKTESIIYCEMGPRQRELYEDLKAAIKNDVYKLVQTDGLQKSKFKILEGLLRLRQMCNSPMIIDSSEPKNKESAKIKQLEELLQGELRDKNVLIFSQFVSMLGIIEKSLNGLGIKYSYLDGSTRNREKAVNDFMEDEDCHVFLISLKAGNTGLNLTKADYVFIVDPWWNPAVEAQAIDRTHRIGQDKHVFAYRLICKNSIEEKIMQLQAKKKKIASDIIQVDEQVFKAMGQEQIMDLFE